MSATLSVPTIDRTEAALNSPTGKLRKVFNVQVVFDHADDPQVIVEGTYSARTAIDAAREWAKSVDSKAAIRYFGKRESVTVTRMRKGEPVQVHVPASKNPTAREVLMAKSLAGGGFSVSMPDHGFAIVGTFVGYVAAV